MVNVREDQVGGNHVAEAPEKKGAEGQDQLEVNQLAEASGEEGGGRLNQAGYEGLAEFSEEMGVKDTSTSDTSGEGESKRAKAGEGPQGKEDEKEQSNPDNIKEAEAGMDRENPVKGQKKSVLLKEGELDLGRTEHISKTELSGEQRVRRKETAERPKAKEDEKEALKRMNNTRFRSYRGETAKVRVRAKRDWAGYKRPGDSRDDQGRERDRFVQRSRYRCWITGQHWEPGERGRSQFPQSRGASRHNSREEGSLPKEEQRGTNTKTNSLFSKPLSWWEETLREEAEEVSERTGRKEQDRGGKVHSEERNKASDRMTGTGGRREKKRESKQGHMEL